MNSVLVSCEWLEAHLHDSDIVVLDVSVEKVVGKTPLKYDVLQVIPTSLKCDLETDFTDTDSELANTFPTQEQFDQGIAKLGISKDSTVILYDNQGIYSSPRAWWIFNTMGFEKVRILNGGLPQWIQEQRQTSNVHDDKAEQVALPFCSDFRAGNVCSSEYVLENLSNSRCVVLDARSSGRFSGVEKEPRAGVRSGHIPNSINVPFALLLDGFVFKSEEELAKLFADKLPQSAEQLLFSCGSGMTACIVLAAACIAGFSDLTLYDGSWAEWGSSQLPIDSDQRAMVETN